MSEKLNSNPEESLPEQNPLEAPEAVDKEKMEQEVEDTKNRISKKSEEQEKREDKESVLSEKPKPGETVADSAGETKTGKEAKKSEPEPEQSFRKKAEEELEKTHPQEKDPVIIEMQVDQKLRDEEYMTGIRARVEKDLLLSAFSEMTLDEQDFFNRNRQFEIKGVFGIRGAASLGARDIEGLLAKGLTMDEIRDVRSTFLGKKILPGEKKTMTSDQFDEMIEESLKNKDKEAVRNDMVEKREELRRRYITKAKKLEVEEKLKQEAEKKAGQPIEAKIEEEKSMPEDEKKEKVKQAAILWEKTYEIDRALRRKRKSFDSFKYKKISKDGEEKLFEGEEAKKQAKKDKNAMSKELVALVDEISGKERTIMQRAANIKKEWKKRDLEDYITKQVRLVLEGEEIKFVKDDFVGADSEKMDVNIGFEQIYKELSDPKIKELIERIREQAENFPTIRALEKSLTVGAPIGFHGAEAAERFSKLIEELPDKGGLKERVINLLKQEKRKEKKTKNRK